MCLYPKGAYNNSYIFDDFFRIIPIKRIEFVYSFL